MVGSYVGEVFADCRVAMTDLDGACPHLDARDARNVYRLVEEIRPDLLLHLAAATDVDRCELEPQWAAETNAAGTENVAAACRAFGVTLVYISSAAVFRGGKADP